MITDFLYCKDLYDPIKLGAQTPLRKTDDEWEKLHRNAVGTIWQWVETNICPHMSS